MNKPAMKLPQITSAVWWKGLGVIGCAALLLISLKWAWNTFLGGVFHLPFLGWDQTLAGLVLVAFILACVALVKETGK